MSYRRLRFQPADGPTGISQFCEPPDFSRPAREHRRIAYLPFATGDGTEIIVSSLAITPPNKYSTAQLPWSVGILLQDAATRPGTRLTPITVGS